jgi:hypothetical protein
MLVFVLFTSLLALVLADPVPSAPGPNETFNEGTNCSFAWAGDSNPASQVWKTMNVELMSGSNFAMTHLTTVASGLDGTAAGTHSFPCPQVTPNAAIYFYQFSCPASPNLTWTTRFTIADATGKSTAPAQMTQPGTNDPIPWGSGALVDPTQAVAPPPIGGATANGSSSTSGAGLLVSTSSSSSSVAPLTTTSSSSSTTSSSATVAQATTKATTSANSTSSAAAATGTGASGAVGLSADTRWHALAALGAVAALAAFL